MNWNECYPQSNQPGLSAVTAYVGSPLWEDLCTYLEQMYSVRPTIEHSICSGAPGWNLKYKKNGRALCTLYPAQGYFTCLVSIGTREAMQAELLLNACTEYLRGLYWNTKPFNGGRWLMIAVTTPEILADTKELIALRVKKK